jgi:hypothetical protein
MISAEYSCHDILSFTESWLSENTSTDQQCLEIPDYKFSPFRRDRSNKVGGGVIVYVKNTVNCIIRSDLHVGSIECIWLEIKLNKMHCELVLTYDTPSLRKTGSRNLTGQKTLPTIWGIYMKLVIKYQIFAINSC